MTAAQQLETESADNADMVERKGELSDALVHNIIEAMESDNGGLAIIQDACEQLHCEDQAELLNQLSTPQREQFVTSAGEYLSDYVLPELDEDAAEDVLDAMGAKKTAEVIANLERDDAVQVLEDLPEDRQREILDTLRDDAREELELSFSYPEESAGRLMQNRLVSMPHYWTVGNAIDHMRSQTDLPEHFYVIYAVDHRFHATGIVSLSLLMRSHRDMKLTDIMDTDLHVQQVERDQEDVAHDFRKYGLVEAPVVNREQRLVGTITVDDVVSVMREEGEEDFLKSAGLATQDMYYSLMESMKTRFPWLFVNLLTAIAASFVIDVFEDSIQQLVILAVLMPIIASMGGNAGIQSATIAVRGLATRKIASRNVWYMIRKEVMLGALNGIGLAIITGIGIMVIYGDTKVAGIFATATVVTMTVAGLSGAGLPFLLQKVGIDPAIASGVFLTMLTDIFSFLAFLGLATAMLI